MISLIVCVDSNNGIGKDGKLLSRQKDDLKSFKKNTVGKFVVMGRNTWESIGSKPLPDRHNIVMSSTLKQELGNGFAVVKDIHHLLDFNLRFPSSEIMVIGGQQIYEAFLPFASKIYMTTIEHMFDADADAFFPQVNYDEWRLADYSELFLSDEDNEYPYQYKVFNRREVYA